MIKKILICGMCLMFLLGGSVSAQREMPQGTPPEGMEFPEGVEPTQGMPESREGFPGGEQGQRLQGNTEDVQTENGQQADETGENANQLQEQGQNAEQMPPPNINFGGGNMPSGFGSVNAQTQAEPMTFMSFVKEYQTPIISVLLLLLAFVFVRFYKRKNY